MPIGDGEGRTLGHKMVTVCPELRAVPLGGDVQKGRRLQRGSWKHWDTVVGNPTEFTPELCGET